MNENVTNKTPKRRRWIARLLVSALCILLASSLLFVGVVAENIVLTRSSSFTFSSSSSPYNPVFLSEGLVCFGNIRKFYVLNSSGYALTFDLTTSTGYSSSVATSIADYTIAIEGNTVYIVQPGKSGSSYATVCLYVLHMADDFLSVVSSTFTSYTVPVSFSYGSVSLYAGVGTISVENSVIYGLFRVSGSDSSFNHYYRFYPYYIQNGVLTSFDPFSFTSATRTLNTDYIHSATSFSNGILYNPHINYMVSYNSGSSVEVSLGALAYNSAVGSFVYNGSIYTLNSADLCVLDVADASLARVGSGISRTTWSCKVFDGVLFVLSNYNSSRDLLYGYSYSGLPTPEPPPESSDETTEDPPPESSDDSSEESSENTLKIWKTEFERDGSFASVALTTIDSSNVETIKAFLGGVAASDSDVSYDGSSVLSVELIDSGGSTIDILTFGFSAWGFALADGYTENFTFPDYVGYWFTLPYSGQQDLYFADVSPFGSVLINSYDSVDGTSARVGINLTSVDSYCKFDFGGDDVFGIRVFNSNPDGNFKQFDFGVTAYKEYYYSASGSSLESDWISVPDSSEEGYSLTFSSSDIVNGGLYGFFLKASKSVYPSINSERLDEISLDYELLESKANDLYGHFSFDSLFGDNFGGAVDEFNDIKDSSGGSYVLNYLLGMWSIHPFASSMVAIVGTLAIVGFIIRKM